MLGLYLPMVQTAGFRLLSEWNLDNDARLPVPGAIETNVVVNPHGNQGNSDIPTDATAQLYRSIKVSS